jgi:opine dehydrogenase
MIDASTMTDTATDTGSALVLGAGAGAHCWAAHLQEAGWQVAMASRTHEALDAVRAAGGFTFVDGSRTRLVPVEVGTSIDEAVAGAAVIVLCVPADRLAWYRTSVLPLVGAHQSVILAPGNTGGALFLAQPFGFDPPFDLVEMNTLPFVARMESAGVVRQHAALAHVYWASAAAEVSERTRNVLDRLVPGGMRVPSVLQTALTNFNPIVHPPAMLVNAGRIETSGAFLWYRDGSTGAAGRIMDALDEERMVIQEALGLPRVSFGAFFELAGYSPGTSTAHGIAATLRGSAANATIVGPASLEHRFLTEDVPFGLVPMLALADAAGVDVPALRATTTLAMIVAREFLPVHAFDARALGLDQLALPELRALARAEEWPAPVPPGRHDHEP